MAQRRISRNSTENSLSHSTKKLRRKTILFCNKLLVSKNYYEERGEGVSGLSVKCFLSQSAEKLPRRTRLCFRKFLVSKHSMDKGQGSITTFRQKICVSHGQKYS